MNDDSLTITFCFTFMQLSSSETRHMIHTVLACNHYIYRWLSFFFFYFQPKRWIAFLSFSVPSCSVVLQYYQQRKVKASRPHNRVTFSAMVLWSQIQSVKHGGWEKIREWFPLTLSLCEKVQVSYSLWSAQVQHSFIRCVKNKEMLIFTRRVLVAVHKMCFFKKTP